MAIIKLDGGYNALPISYKRGNPIPLDTTAVWYDFEELKTYAQSGVTAYVGQVLTYVDSENNTATAYVIANTAGDLEPIGTAPVGDETSIEVDANGTVSLAGIKALVFEREVDVLGEDGEATGEKTTEEVQYQPLMTKEGLVWIEPSKTTVEGLATLIDALTARVATLEGSVAGHTESIGDLEDALEAETDRATKAEAALDERLGAIEDDHVKAADIANFETKANVQAVDKKITDYVAANDEALAGVKATAEAAATKVYVEEELGKKAAQTDLTALQSKVDAFLTGTGTVEDTLDSLQELINYINTHDDTDISGILASIKAVEDKLAGINTTVADYVSAAIAALSIGDYAKASDLAALAARVSTLEGKVDVEKVSTAIEAAKEAAIGAAADDATAKANKALEDAKADAEKYATKVYVGTIPNGEDGNPKAENVVAYIEAKAAEVLSQATGGSSESAASVKGQLDTFKAEINPKVTKNTEDIATINNKLEGIAEGADVNVIETIKVNDSALTPDENKAVNITVPTKVTDLTDYNTLNNSIIEAKAAGDNAKAAADAAQVTANEAKAAATANGNTLSTLSPKVDNNAENIGKHETRIGNLESFKDTHEAAHATLEATVAGHTAAIAEKAAQVALNATIEDVTKNATAIKTLNEVTIPNLDARVAETEAATITSGVVAHATQDNAEGIKIETDGTTKKITVTVDAYKKAEADKAISDAVSALEIDKVNAAIKDNADAIATLIGDDKAASIRDIAANEVAKVVNENNNGSVDTLNEIAAWIISDTTGAAKMNADIVANKAILAGIGGEGDTHKTVVAAIEAAKEEAIEAATYTLPTAEVEVLGGIKSGATTAEGIAVNANEVIVDKASGIAKVNKLDVSALFIPEGSVLVLNGGKATD